MGIKFQISSQLSLKFQISGQISMKFIGKIHGNIKIVIRKYKSVHKYTKSIWKYTKSIWKYMENVVLFKFQILYFTERLDNISMSDGSLGYKGSCVIA